MTDAIGQPLSVGDYVTAVWANAEVALFEVVDFKESGDVLILKRLFNSNVSETTQNKLVKKFNSQATKVPADAVRDYIIMFKLEN